MYIKDLKKDTKVIRKEGSGFFVDAVTKEGITTMRTTSDPTLAKQFTLKEMFETIYNDMSADDIKSVREAHASGKDSYSTVLAYRCQDYRVIKPESIQYGYSNDMAHEKRLLNELDLSYIIDTPKVVIKLIDAEDEDE
jgi:hypothetical protein